MRREEDIRQLPVNNTSLFLFTISFIFFLTQKEQVPSIFFQDDFDLSKKDFFEKLISSDVLATTQLQEEKVYFS